MKKIIIVNNNMKVGGVQKSLYNLLWALDGRYEITLLLFSDRGVYTNQLPPEVKVIRCTSLFRYLGVSQEECGGKLPDRLKRGCLAAVCRLFGRSAVMKLLLASQKTLPQRYDCAIAYLHNGGIRSFYGGVQEFVLHRIRAERKIAFIHGDHDRCGGNDPYNNRLLSRFHRIAPCSDGCRRALLAVLPELADRCVTVRNCHRFDQIRAKAWEDPVRYDSACIHVAAVSRLSREKGLDRAIRAVREAADQGYPVRLHIVGSGALEQSLRSLAGELALTDRVFFYGEQENPYRYMAKADLFLMTSYHEAAPMVIEEARCLGIPVLTTQTTSSREMVEDPCCGWVCRNTQEDLNRALCAVLADPSGRERIRKEINNQPMDNSQALAQFFALIEG